MNSTTSFEAAAFTRAPYVPRVTTKDVCDTLRNWQMPSHEEWVTVVANFAAKVLTPNSLSGTCASVVVDMLDEIVGQIEQDQINQQAETMWADNKRLSA